MFYEHRPIVRGFCYASECRRKAKMGFRESGELA